MGYNNLSESTLSAKERIEEKDRITGRLMLILRELTDDEANFVSKMNVYNFCTIKQLFYLRDINNKY